MARTTPTIPRIAAVFAAMAALLAACDTSNDTLTKPSLTVLRIEGEPFYVNVPTTLRGTASFADTDANVTRLDLVVTGPDNIPTPVELPIQNATGLKEGTFTFELEVTFVLPGRFQVAGTIVDAKGQRSNPLITTFDVEAGDAAPKLSGLTTDLPDEASVGLPLAASGTFDFLAVNGDIASIRVEVERNGDVVHTATITPPAADVSGKKNGTLAFDLDFTPRTDGLARARRHGRRHRRRALERTP
jgi:hypothetical protein